MRKFLVSILFICIINIFTPMNLSSQDNNNQCNSETTDLNYCKAIIDSYRFLLQIYEDRFDEKAKILDSETIKYINNINLKIQKQKQICNYEEVEQEDKLCRQRYNRCNTHQHIQVSKAAKRFKVSERIISARETCNTDVV